MGTGLQLVNKYNNKTQARANVKMNLQLHLIYYF